MVRCFKHIYRGLDLFDGKPGLLRDGKPVLVHKAATIGMCDQVRENEDFVRTAAQCALI